jgi:long-chain fatty acid transport protein
MNKFKITLSVFVLTAFVSSVAHATNGAQYTGFGAISQSLGGATVASGWDTISAIANPASFGLLEGDRTDMSFEYYMPTRSINTVQSDYKGLLPLSGGMAVKTPSGKITYGLSWGHVFGLGTDFNNGALPSSSIETPGVGRVYAQYTIFKFIPIIAYTPTENLSIGFGPGLTWQTLEISRPFDMNGNGLYDTQMTANNSNAYGFGVNVGAIYKWSDIVRLGASYTSKQHLSDHKWNTEVGNIHYEKNGVEQAAFGIAISPMNNLTVEVDERWLRWSGMLAKAVLKLNGNDLTTLDLGWEDQWVTALGITYVPVNGLSLRVGFNYGKSPIKDKNVDANLFSQAYVERHVMAGLGYTVTKNVELNIGYGHGFEKELTSPTTGTKIKASDDWVDFMMSHKF